MKKHVYLFTVLLISLFITQTASASNYTIIDISAFIGGVGYAERISINNAGQIVGQYEDSDGSHHGFLYTGSGIIDFGKYTNATAINNLGQVVVSSIMGSNPVFIYSNGVMSPLEPLNGAYPYGINNSGQIVGGTATFTHYSRPFLYSGGVMQNLSGFEDEIGSAVAINDSGQIVGQIGDGLSSRAFLYSGGTMQKLVTLGGNDGSAISINNLGQIVGYSTPATQIWGHAFLYSDGVIQDLDTLGGYSSNALCINNLGQIVGISEISKTRWGYHAFIYTNGQMIDLNTLIPEGAGWELVMARGINDNGQIVGLGTIGGEKHIFLMTPVPEPSPPKAICHDVTMAAGSNCTADASIDNGSNEPNGNPVTLSQAPAGPYQLGTTPVTLTVTDSKNPSSQSQCTGTVTVVDQTPPVIAMASVNPSVLWPPNHKMVDVTVNYNATDNCVQPACQISSVTSNESINSSDYTIVDAHHVKLFAEREGKGTGRVYTITITCNDTSGNSSSQRVTVTVPHDQGK